MNTPAHDRQTFLVHLRDSGLLAPEKFRDWMKKLPETENRGKAIARLAVDQGLLTKFQARRLLAGRTTGWIIGQYRILDEIGRGGMGRVYKAEHQTMNRIVALKVLAAHLTRTERARQLFDREIRAAARLVHPNIVTAFDANQLADSGRLYLVLEYVDGPNLQELVRDKGPLPLSQACDFIRQAALGLHHAHECGMVHRDIKPANLLVQRLPGRAADSPLAFQVKILDFGLARLSDPATGQPIGGETGEINASQVMGTPDFLPPEQARDIRSVDGRGDLYSLGCTFYFLLTGRVPFPGGSAIEKLVRHGTEDPTPVEHFRPDVTLPIAQILRRMMAKAPEDRFQTGEDLAAALAPYCVAEARGSWVEWQALQPPASDAEIQLPTGGQSSLGPSETTLDPNRRRAEQQDSDDDLPGTLERRPHSDSYSQLRTGRRKKNTWLLPVLISVLVLTAGLCAAWVILKSRFPGLL